MKAFKITMILLVILLLIHWVRGGEDFHIAKVLPFCGGAKPGLYDIGAVALVLLCIWGLSRLGHRSQSDDFYEDEDDQDSYYDDDDDDE